MHNKESPPFNAVSRARQAAAYGLTIREIAATFEVGPGTFDRWRKEFPAINQAIGDGRANPHPDALRQVKGQTGSYRRFLNYEELQLLASHAARGANIDQCAEAIGIDRHVLGTLIREDEEAAHAYRLGKSQEETALVGALYARATDKADHSGAISAMFLLKSRHGYSDSGAAIANINVQATPDEIARDIHATLIAMDQADGLTGEQPELIEHQTYD